MSKSRDPRQGVDRRAFIRQASLGAASLMSIGAVGTRGERAPIKTSLPTTRLGDHEISRLMVGYNPIGGFSHATSNLSEHMRGYFTAERTAEFLQYCEGLGINAFQFDLSPKVEQAFEVLYGQGSSLQFVCLHAERRNDPPLEAVLKWNPIAIVHHGGVTDSLFRAGRAREVRDYVKKVRDAGVLAGVSSHCPANIARIAEEGWEVDLFMASFHNVSRTNEEMEKELGYVTVDEPFLECDPPKMAQVIQQVDQPCLAFKILAAGRRCSSQNRVAQAFRYAFENIKKKDAVIVGMFPLYRDEPRLNVDYVKRYGMV